MNALSLDAGSLWYLVIEDFVFYACFAWLAWRDERTTGTDSFHVVATYALGVWVIAFASKFGTWWVFGGAIAGVVAAQVFRWGWVRGVSGRDRTEVLIRATILATVALLLFDWGTRHHPIDVSGTGQYLKEVAIVTGLLALLFIAATASDPSTLALRLGNNDRWALTHWNAELKPRTWAYAVVASCAWFACMVIPLASIGLMSTDILKYSAVAILIARVSGSRGPLVILGAAATLAGMRSWIGFTVNNRYAAPLVEFAAIAVLLLWLRYRSSRTPWSEQEVR